MLLIAEHIPARRWRDPTNEEDIVPDETIDRTQLARSWTHSHEEDHDGLLVFRPSDRKFPPARGRRSMNLAPDGTLRRAGPGPDDRTVESGGTWTLDGCRLDLQPVGSAPISYVIAELSADRLVVRDVHDEADGRTIHHGNEGPR